MSSAEMFAKHLHIRSSNEGEVAVDQFMPSGLNSIIFLPNIFELALFHWRGIWRGIKKTSLFKYTENFTTKKWKFSDKNSFYLFFFLCIFLLKTFTTKISQIFR